MYFWPRAKCQKGLLGARRESSASELGKTENIVRVHCRQIRKSRKGPAGVYPSRRKFQPFGNCEKIELQNTTGAHHIVLSISILCQGGPKNVLIIRNDALMWW
jgi:hypothetical protein